MTLVLISSATFMVGAVAPSVDTETTDTATTSELRAGNVQAYNETTNTRLSYSQDSNKTAVAVHQGNRELAEYGSNSSSDVVVYQTAASGTYYFNATFADDGSTYTGLEADAGETVTLTAEMINKADDPVTNQTINYDFTAGQNVSFVHMNNSETMVADSTGAGIRASVFSIGGNDSDAGAAEVTQESIGVNGDNQDTVNVHIANAQAQDSAAAVYSATEGSEAFSTVGVATFNGETIPVFAEGQSTPSWFDEDMTYATVSEDGTTVTVLNAGESLSADDTEADFSMEANDAIGFGNARTLASDYGAGTIDSLSVGIDALNLNGQPELAEV
ncbi:hypothetical protein [Haloarcula argentinensis]|uniref:Uncharacterized protein n=1 Tax=Haloarcula argentinensis TaxID=43776 RepID=A0A847URP5_HALAR|nr:hypothetical protein [Haloarcula argentinensis]NLV14368.1 hypothetical protein [Haloarcula argentinensis]